MFGLNTGDPGQGNEVEELLLEYAAPAETKPPQFRHDIQQLTSVARTHRPHLVSHALKGKTFFNLDKQREFFLIIASKSDKLT